MKPVGWRWPLALSACVVVAQVFPVPPLVEVVSGAAPADLRLVYPLTHVVLAPLTLLADWLNGSPARELTGFLAWLLVFWSAARVLRWRRRAEGGIGARVVGELRAALLLVLVLAAFAAWGVYAPRPIARLVADDPDALVYDVHSHTEASHDGRRGFDAAANAAWHERAGFDAAFVTDHNTGVAIRAWLAAAAPGAPRLLPGIELSLSGLHLLALGTAAEIPNERYRGSWDATGALLRALAAGAPPPGDSVGVGRPFLVASLPEYWRYHRGPGIDSLVAWGVGGFELWTTSPRAMDFPSDLRAGIIARSRRAGLALFGATDMHGLGSAASVWNVETLPGWRAMDTRALGAALLARWRSGGADANRVVVRRRWLPARPLEAGVAVPVNLALLLRTASPAHALTLLCWIWIPALLSSRRRAPRSP